MIKTTHEVHQELYWEHLQEIAFLWQQRHFLSQDEETHWPDLASYENRLEAHLDALVVGETAALGTCVQQARKGDAGELYGAVRVICRHDRWDMLVSLCNEGSFADESRLQALADALMLELALERTQDLLALAQGVEQIIPAALRFLGYRRVRGVEARINDPQIANHSPMLAAWAFSRLADCDDYGKLWQWLYNGDAELQACAARALLRRHDPQIAPYLASMNTGWSSLLLAMMGDHNVCWEQAMWAKQNVNDSHSLLALGMGGLPEAVLVLLDALEGESASSAALGLYLLTGAELYEEVFVPDYEHASYGCYVQRLCQCRKTWQNWWDSNLQRFKVGQRYRGGQPHSAQALVAGLANPRMPNFIRAWIHDELVIHYRLDIPFELEMPIASQLQVIGQYRQMLAK